MIYRFEGDVSLVVSHCLCSLQGPLYLGELNMIDGNLLLVIFNVTQWAQNAKSVYINASPPSLKILNG